MLDTPLHGERTKGVRQLTSSTKIAVGDVELALVTENIAAPTDWSWRESHHVIVIHRHGRMRTMEFDIEHGPSGRALPNIGDVWVIPAEHQYAALAQGDTVQYCQLSIPTRAITRGTVTPAIGQRDSLTYHLIERINKVKSRHDVFALLLIESLTESLLLHLADRHTGDGPVQPPFYRELDRAAQAALIEYLDASPDHLIGLAQLARCCGMTVREFSRAFSATFQTTPYQFFLNRRITEAKRLLTHSSLSIADIGSAIGLSDPSHFTATFENHVGTTPRAYRDNT
jgi:AraC family transcriptional regulator